jgi:lysophospholipase L1-like esterase
MRTRGSTWPGRCAAVLCALSLAAIVTSHRASAQNAPTVAATNPQEPARGAGERAKEKVDDAAEKLDDIVRRAADIFKRVPCANRNARLEGSLPVVARKLASSQPVTIVAFGSSSTVGHGATSPVFSYPYRLADQLRRKFPQADITVLNRGVGGEDASQMMARLQPAVIDAKPDLVIWQVGTNIILRGDDAAIVRTEALVNDGIDRIKLAGSDIVLIDPQYAPATTGDRQGKSDTMVNLLQRVSRTKQVARFPRFAVMREWHDNQKLSFDQFVTGDGLHLNDWGYACFAQLLGDMIIDSVSRAQAGNEQQPGDVLLYRPL